MIARALAVAVVVALGAPPSPLALSGGGAAGQDDSPPAAYATGSALDDGDLDAAEAGGGGYLAQRMREVARSALASRDRAALPEVARDPFRLLAEQESGRPIADLLRERAELAERAQQAAGAAAATATDGTGATSSSDQAGAVRASDPFLRERLERLELRAVLADRGGKGAALVGRRIVRPGDALLEGACIVSRITPEGVFVRFGADAADTLLPLPPPRFLDGAAGGAGDPGNAASDGDGSER